MPIPSANQAGEQYKNYAARESNEQLGKGNRSREARRQIIEQVQRVKDEHTQKSAQYPDDEIPQPPSPCAARALHYNR